MLSKTLTCLCFAVASVSTVAQVSNNNIQDRTELILDASPLQSNTANSSVEWGCINKALTNRCLIYHNDQWFHFTPRRDGNFFLNVSSLQCRDLRGIQVIVIEGNPCEIDTYRILQCIPKIHQDDVFIELDSLKADTQYLVNVDGFLGDFCQFDIQFAKSPKGFSRTQDNLDTLNMKAVLKDSIVTIRWSIHETIADEIKFIKIYRLGGEEQKSSLIKELPLRANALGDYEQEYSLEDFLFKQDVYTYRIFGIQKETEFPLLLDEQKISFLNSRKSREVASTWVYIPLELKKGLRYQVLVFNRIDYSLLRKYVGDFDESKDSTFEINLQELISLGIKEFIILASEVNSNQSKEYYYREDGGRIVEK